MLLLHRPSIAPIKGLSISIALLCIAVLTVTFIHPPEDNKVYHFTSKEGITGQYRFYPAKQPQGVLLWLHGDGATEFYEPDSTRYLEGANGIKRAAEDNHLTLIVPKTPSQDDTWWQDGEQNAEYLKEFIRSIPGHETLWIGSFSGGSEEVSYWLLKDLKQADVKQGGAVLFGGGGSPKAEGIVDVLNKEDVITQPFPLTWIVGETDNGNDKYAKGFNSLKKSEESAAFYHSQNWDTKRIIVEGHGHLLSDNDKGLYGMYLNEVIRGNRDHIQPHRH